MPIHLLTDEDTFLAVAEAVAQSLQGGEAKTAPPAAESELVQECAALLAAQQFERYLDALRPHLDAVLAKSSDKEAECVANVLVHAVTRAPKDRTHAAAVSLAAALTSKVDERAEQRLGALLNLYGGVSEQPTTQRAMLLSAADYARNLPNLAAILVPAVRGKSHEWVRLWKLSEAESRELFIVLATLVKIGTDRASVKEYVRLVTAALALCPAGDSAAIAQLRPMALAAVTDFIRNPSIYQADFAASPAVKALAQDAAAAPVYSLFEAIVSGDIKSYHAAAKAPVLEQVGVAAETALTKARLVALLVLCGGGSQKEVAFASIQQALDIPASAVEAWVVRAIGAKLIEGKMDQVQGLVVITRCTECVFGSEQWAAVRDQLAAWRDSLSGAGQLLSSMHVAAASGAAGAGAKPAIAAAL